MRSALLFDGKKFSEYQFKDEEEFEQIVKRKSKSLFGEKTVYFDLKNRVDTKFIGGTIPDGFLFDFNDMESPEFYLVEIELARHDFDKHIFPQITKFFGFYKNRSNVNELVDKLYRLLNSNPELKQDFSQFVKEGEFYKTIKDILDDSRKVLIIIDDEKSEIDEMSEIYTDTWGSMLRLEVIKLYTHNGQQILQMNPEFEAIELVENGSGGREPDHEKEIYDEDFHLKIIEQRTAELYQKIKEGILSFDSSIIINSQKYYISLKGKRNFAFIKFRKKKLRIVVMLPLETGRQLIKKYIVTPLGEGVQNFYNGPCFVIEVDNDKNLDEILEILKKSYQNQK
jgi:predicted transport protein